MRKRCVNFYKCFPEYSFTKFETFLVNVCHLFVETYICELQQQHQQQQTYSRMKFEKSDDRLSVRGEHLK